MKRRAITLVDVLMVLLVVIILYLVFVETHNYGRIPPVRSMCASNLRQIGIGLFAYAQDNNNAFPMIDLKSGEITGIEKVQRNAKPNDIDNPFIDIPDSANRSVSENLWLLVRTGLATPKVFICPATPENKVDDPLTETDGKLTSPKYFVNFFAISYSFPQPWSAWGSKKACDAIWSANIKPDVVLGADANNGSQPNYPLDTLSGRWPSSNGDLKKYVNSTNHNGEGQNILMGDASICFQKTPYAGIHQNNIYTAQPPEHVGEAGKTPGILSVRPKDENDSVLIPNREADLKAWDRKP